MGITKGTESKWLLLLVVFVLYSSSSKVNAEDHVLLEMQLTRQMKFPKITIDEASKNNAICVANGVRNPPDSLCSQKKGNLQKLKSRVLQT